MLCTRTIFLASTMMVSPHSEAATNTSTTSCSGINSNNKLLDTVQSFLQHLDVELNYENASKYLTDDFTFQSPKYNCKSKSQWISTFPEFHKNSLPTFEPPMLGTSGS